MTIQLALYEHILDRLQIRDRGQIMVHGLRQLIRMPPTNLDPLYEYTITATVTRYPFMQIVFGDETAEIRTKVPREIPIADKEAINYNTVTPIPRNGKHRKKWKRMNLNHNTLFKLFEVTNSNTNTIVFQLYNPNSIQLVEYFSHNIITTMKYMIKVGSTVEYVRNMSYSINLIENARQECMIANPRLFRCV